MSWENTGLYDHCNWWYDVNDSSDVVVQFDDVTLQPPDPTGPGDLLSVFHGRQTRRFSGADPVQALIVPAGRLLMLEIISGGRPVTRFNMSVTPYPRHTLPPEIETGVYNCSPPYVVPQEMQCDGIVQCQAAQDELDYNCSYTRLGCDDGWIAEGIFCFKFRFPTYPVSPDQAQAVCREEHNADVGSLPYPGARRLATSLVSRHGFADLVVGLKKVQTGSQPVSHLYRFLWRWLQAGTEFDGPQPADRNHNCAALSSRNQLLAVNCSSNSSSGIVCSKLNPKRVPTPGLENIALPAASSKLFRVRVKECPSHHFVHLFHPCTSHAETNVTPPASLPYLSCKNGRHVHYTLTCNGYDDCGDVTDEQNCGDVRSYHLLTSSFICTRQAELVDKSSRCNGIRDCHDGSDEEDCETCSEGMTLCAAMGCVPCGSTLCSPHAASDGAGQEEAASRLTQVTVDSFGLVLLHSVTTCPQSYFQCGAQNGGRRYCIPGFAVGNGQPDCPPNVRYQALDEPSGEVQCPGQYRCYRYKSCIPPDLLCDGVYQCPLKDDERYCDMPCPLFCTCEGLAYTCTRMFDPGDYLRVRYLDLSGSFKPPLEKLHYMGYLHFLNLSSCGLDGLSLAGLVHLRVLDLSNNVGLELAEATPDLPALETLSVSGCALFNVTTELMTQAGASDE